MNFKKFATIMMTSTLVCSQMITPVLADDITTDTTTQQEAANEAAEEPVQVEEVVEVPEEPVVEEPVYEEPVIEEPVVDETPVEEPVEEPKEDIVETPEVPKTDEVVEQPTEKPEEGPVEDTTKDPSETPETPAKPEENPSENDEKKDETTSEDTKEDTKEDSVEKPETPEEPTTPETPETPSKPEENPSENDEKKDETTSEDTKEDQKEDTTEDPAEKPDEEPTVTPAETPEEKPAEEVKDEVKEDTVTVQNDSVVNYESTYSVENANYSVKHYSVDLDIERFVAAVGESAKIVADKYDLYASVMIAQSILESGYGNTALGSNPYFNLYGMKGSFNGHSVNFNTNECNPDGSFYTIQSNFRDYDNYFESMNDYANLLNGTSSLTDYYKGATKSVAKSPEDACKWLQGRYATDINYASKLMSLIETYDLTRYDLKDNNYINTVNSSDAKLIVNEDGSSEYRDYTMLDYAKLEAVATSKLGYNYVWGGESDEEGGYDCSGLVLYSYQQAFGITLPRTSKEMSSLGVEVSFDDLKMGDLLFFSNNEEGVHHVAMYLGNGYYIQSPKPGDVVKITSIDEYRPSFAKRIITFDSLDEKGNVIDKDGNVKLTNKDRIENEKAVDSEIFHK